MISKSLQEELIKNGYTNITEDILKDLDKLDSNMRRDIEHIEVEVEKEEKARELNMVSTKGLPLIITKDCDVKEKTPLLEQIKKGREADFFVNSHEYANKEDALVLAHSYAKRHNLNEKKLKDNVVDTIDYKTNEKYNIMSILDNTNFVFGQDAERKRLEEERIRNKVEEEKRNAELKEELAVAATVMEMVL